MKWVLRVLAGVVVVVVGLVATAWLLVRSASPAIPLEGPQEDSRGAVLEAVLDNVGDPRTLEEGSEGEVRLTPAQVDALAAEASRRFPEASGTIELQDGAARVRVSVISPFPGLSPYLDLTATVSGTPKDPRVEDAWVGYLPVPRTLAQRAVDRVQKRIDERHRRTAQLLEAVQGVELREDALTVRYLWTGTLADAVRETGRDMVVRSLGRDRLVAYLERLRDFLGATIETPAAGKPNVPLVALLQPLFGLAATRTDAGGAPVAELRAAVLVATYYTVGRSLGGLLGPAAGRPLPEARVRLWDRPDLPKHYLVSALLTLFGDRAFADALGLEKELADADGGSGFSFADLAADRAGTQLMARATRGPGSDQRVRALLARLSRPLEDGDLVPKVADLPEGMDQAAFEAAYQAPGSPAYQELVDRIDARIEATEVFAAVR